jgi:hypothetical protein
MTGYVDYGNLRSTTKAVVATCALFVLATEINGNLKVPIAYLLTNGCDAELLVLVISNALEKMHENGGTVLNITFDGLPANFSAAEKLGADLNVFSSTFKTYMNHPSTNSKVYFIPDACHMIKLMRNTLQEYQALSDGDGKVIKWSYWKNLLQLQQSEGLKLGNKITVRHVNFSRQKMKVKLAVQLFSSSVAVAFDSCREMGFPEFADSEATSRFVKLLDR